MTAWTRVGFADAVQSRGSGGDGLPQSQWAEHGKYPVIGQGSEFIEGWTNRDDLVVTPKPAVVLYGGHTRRAKFVDRPFVPGPNVKILEPGDRLDAKFLFYFLAQLPIASRGYADHFPEVRRCSVPIPPLAQQRRIAEVLDRAEALRANRRAALAQLDTLTDSIFLDMFGDPATNPKGWPVGVLKGLGQVVTGGTPPSAKEGMFDGPVPFITPGDLESDEPIKRSLTTAGAEESRTVGAGATLVCCIGATIGKIGKSTVRSAFNQQINAVEWGERVHPEYGYAVMHFFKPTIVAWGASTTLPILKKSSFERVEIPVPPVSTQEHFARRVEMLDRIRTANRAALATSGELFSALQATAFRGGL